MVNNIEKKIQWDSPQSPQTSSNMTKGGIPRGLVWGKRTVELTQFIEEKRVAQENDVRLSVNRILWEEQL